MDQETPSERRSLRLQSFQDLCMEVTSLHRRMSSGALHPLSACKHLNSRLRTGWRDHFCTIMIYMVLVVVQIPG